MPLYRYRCVHCDADTLVWFTRADRRTAVACGHCRTRRATLVPPGRIHVNCNRLDFVTSDITGQPVRIQTQAQHDRLCREHGVTRATADDVRVERKKSTAERIRQELRNGPSMKETVERALAETGLRRSDFRRKKKRAAVHA